MRYLTWLETHHFAANTAQIRRLQLSRFILWWHDRYLKEARPRLVRDSSQLLLFVTIQGGPTHPNNVSALVRRYLRQAGIHKQGACHLFRHSAASLMLDAGADVRHLQELLGHKSLATTQIYTHVSIGKLCEVHARTHPARLPRGNSPRRTRSGRILSPVCRRCRQLLGSLLARAGRLPWLSGREDPEATST
jgi:integrase/recombinase XerD